MEELSQEGIKVPAAAIITEVLAKHVDFLALEQMICSNIQWQLTERMSKTLIFIARCFRQY